MLSVIIPIYNVEEYIQDCLFSLIKQTYTEPFECILVDDCGTDNSISICQSIIQSYSGNIMFRIVNHTHNRGLSAARNTGVKAAKGGYICFIDSDDCVAPDMLEILMSYINQNPTYGIVGCNCSKFIGSNYSDFVWNYTETSIIYPQEFADNLLLMKFPHTAWGKVYKRDIFDKILFREGRVNEDVLFILDVFPVIEKDNIITCFIPQKLYYYRQRPNSICRSNKKPFYIDEIENMETVLNTIEPIKYDLFLKLLTKHISKVIHHCVIISNKKHINHSYYSYLCELLRHQKMFLAFQLLTVKGFVLFLMFRYLPTTYRYFFPYKAEYLELE